MRLFEFEDQMWFPAQWRRWQMDYIRFAVKLLDPYHALKSPFSDHGTPSVWVDLASGTGGPISDLEERWQTPSSSFSLIRTDLFPANENIKELDLRSDEYLPADHYTLFNAFHHFPKEEQLRIMSRMSRAKSALIAEPLSPNLLTFVGIFVLTGPGSWILTPFIKPFSWGRLFWTYLVPVLPFVTCWDGLVSVLRSPSRRYFQVLASKASTTDFEWRADSLSFFFGRVNLLIGNRIRTNE